MGRRQRQTRLRAPDTDYVDPDGNLLRLRGALKPGARVEYASIATGQQLAPSANREDAWQRAVEFLFERLTVRWEIAGVAVASQRDLIRRFRASTPAERAWIRSTLRDHCADHFPDLEAP
ncbi:MAG TPA: hypothetical protein VHW26_00600 [Solirubrobacteraceae bacterium]|jgi:hypothetical protein|nr:hypothetical protein [Solirubrobacteraceae bacterium]